MDEEIEAAGKLAPEGPIADATVRVKSPSKQGIRGIMETAARLTTKYFEDTGFYFQASAEYDGPVFF